MMDQTCKTCHTQKKEYLLVKAHIEAGAAWKAGATEAEMQPVLTLIRHSQWRWDFSIDSHGCKRS